MNVVMRRAYACDTRATSSQAFAADDEFAFENIDKFRSAVRVDGDTCTGIQSDELHL